jgi:prolyl-tRNA editing enzyme YbaK/EbsC (Cys-tRNA(Pro) deacylase)
MLEDFIEFNELKAEIINFSTNTPTNTLIASNALPPKSTIKVQLFNSKKIEPIIIITPFHSELNTKIIKSIMGEEEIIEMNDKEAIEITGYRKDCIPPISIYGIKIVIDKSLENKKILYSRVGEKKFLKVSLNEILKTNDDITFEEIIKK